MGSEPPHLENVLSRLNNVKAFNGYYKASCPAHTDNNPSLSIWLNDQLKVSMKCHAGCDNLDILPAINLALADLYPQEGKTLVTTKSKIVAVYDYHDIKGNVVHQTVRYEGKEFKQRRPGKNGELIWSLKGIEPMLYRLPELVQAVSAGETVFVVEGEKDVDNAREHLGIPATTAPMGAGSWRDSHTQFLEGAHVILIPDNDPEGINHIKDVASRLSGVAASVKLVELPDLPHKGDISDWIDMGGTTNKLQELVNNTPLYPLNYGNTGNYGNGGNAGNATPISANELLAMEMPEVQWPVPDILPAGVSLLVGKPKLGKSWLALSLAEAIAAGGVALGAKRVTQGETLYLALEDNYRRLQNRLRKILEGRDAPEGMFIHTEWRRLDEGGAEALDQWLTEHPNARFVCIDTLKKIRPRSNGSNQNVYDRDYEALEKLLPIAAKHNVTILVVHHTRKAAGADPIDEISGSFGLSGGVDGFLVMRRDRSGKGVTLDVDGRDIEDPKEYALTRNLNTATWTIEGEAEEVLISKERSNVLLKLRRHGPQTPKELGELLDKKSGTMRKLLLTMKDDGQVVKDEDERYRVPEVGNGNGNGSNGRNPAKVSQIGDSVTTVTGVTVDEGSGPESLFSESRREEDNQAPQRPYSFGAKEGESTTLSELKRRREMQQDEHEDEITFDEDEEGTSALLMAGWKPVEGMWQQPGTTFKRDQRTALGILNDDPAFVEKY